MFKFQLCIFPLNLWTRLFCYLLIYHLFFITAKLEETTSMRPSKENPQFGEIQRINFKYCKRLCRRDTLNVSSQLCCVALRVIYKNSSECIYNRRKEIVFDNGLLKKFMGHKNSTVKKDLLSKSCVRLQTIALVRQLEQIMEGFWLKESTMAEYKSRIKRKLVSKSLQCHFCNTKYSALST